MQKLAAHASRMEHFSDARKAEVTSEYYELDKNGKVEHHIHSESQVVLVDGKPMTRVLLATKDGQDNLKDSQKQALKEDRKGRKLEPPFSVANQPKYRFSMLGPAEQGLQRIGFGPKEGKSTEILEGEAVVESLGRRAGADDRTPLEESGLRRSNRHAAGVRASDLGGPHALEGLLRGRRRVPVLP